MRGEGGDASERNFPSPVCHFGGFYASPLQCAIIGFCSAPLTSCASPLIDSSTEIFPLYLDISSYVSQKRGRPEHPTPLPCIAINRAARTRTSSLERLVCMRISRAAQNWQNTQLSGPPLPRRPRVRPSPVTPVSRPLHDLCQPIFRESPPSSPSPFIPRKRMANQRGKIAHIFLPTTKSTTTPFARWAPPGRGPSALWPWRPYWMICVFHSVVSS